MSRQAYATGDGVKQDYKSAALWYRRAMELGCPVCSYELARFYGRSLGVGRDPSARLWVEPGSTPADADGPRGPSV